jgi:hypothetical protein
MHPATAELSTSCSRQRRRACRTAVRWILWQSSTSYAFLFSEFSFCIIIYRLISTIITTYIGPHVLPPKSNVYFANSVVTVFIDHDL